MGKHDSFFSEKAPESLNKKILARAEAEMDMLRKKDRKSKFLGFLLPFGTAAAVSVLAISLYLNIGINKNNISEGEAAGVVAMAALGNEFVNQLMEEEEALEMVDELGVLEDFENLVAMSDTDLEGAYE